MEGIQVKQEEVKSNQTEVKTMSKNKTEKAVKDGVSVKGAEAAELLILEQVLGPRAGPKLNISKEMITAMVFGTKDKDGNSNQDGLTDDVRRLATKLVIRVLKEVDPDVKANLDGVPRTQQVTEETKVKINILVSKVLKKMAFAFLDKRDKEVLMKLGNEAKAKFEARKSADAGNSGKPK